LFEQAEWKVPNGRWHGGSSSPVQMWKFHDVLE
jgi:hypothetical protein